MRAKIIQLVAPATPVFEVFNFNEDARPYSLPESPEDLFLMPVPILALIEHRDGTQSVVGITATDLGEFSEIRCGNSLGYAGSKEEAVREYVLGAPAPAPTTAPERS